MTAPSRDARYPALDGLRGLAALCIVATHTGFASGRSASHDLLGAVLGRLDISLAVFFLLSGFLLYRPFALHASFGTPAPQMLRFWWKRVLRIVPALWVAVAVTLALITTRQVSLTDWWQYATLVHVYDHHEVDPNLTQLWTLSAELGFYLLLPLLGSLAAYRVRDPYGRQLSIVALLFGVAMAFDVFQDQFLTHNQAQLWLPAYLDWFALGMLLAVLSSGRPRTALAVRFDRTVRAWAAAPATCLAVAAILWAITLTQVGTPRTVVLASFWQWSAQHYLFGAAAFFLMLPLVINPPRTATDLLGSRVGRFLGNVSYGVYLWHLALLLLIQRELGYATFTGHFWLLLMLTTASSIAVATVSWYGIERPALRYGSRDRRRAASGEAPTNTISTAPSVNS
jgi:peptidoglycan/LPS O-acetylase OafA/YrhL